MADKQRDDGKEPLNERERGVPQELARQMVREVGITPSDPEEARRRENDKARVDLWRIIAFLNIALLAGIGATGAFLDRPSPSSIHLLVVCRSWYSWGTTSTPCVPSCLIPATDICLRAVAIHQLRGRAILGGGSLSLCMR